MRDHHRLAKGLISGVWGVLAMSGTGLSIRRWLSETEELSKTDPEITVDWFYDRAGRKSPSPRSRRRIADPIHFMVGGIGGLVYAQATRGRQVPPLLGGVAAATAMWAAGFCGYLPTLGIMPPPWKWDHTKLVTTTTAHLVYGCTMAVVFVHLTGQSGRHTA